MPTRHASNTCIFIRSKTRAPNLCSRCFRIYSPANSPAPAEPGAGRRSPTFWLHVKLKRDPREQAVLAALAAAPEDRVARAVVVAGKDVNLRGFQARWGRRKCLPFSFCALSLIDLATSR